MGLALVTGPALEPIGVAEARAHVRLGADKLLDPPGAPDVSLAGVAGLITAGEHRWRVTFVNADGESDAGEISAALTTVIASNGQVSITNIPIGDDTVTARRVYRTAAGGSTYLRLTTISDNTTTAYTDNLADGSLGAEITVDVIAPLIAAARAQIEGYIERPIIAQTWRLVLDQFPAGTDSDVIELLPSLLSITSITYVDGDGTTQTLSSGDYSADTNSFPGRVVLGYGKYWPTTRDQRNAVTITFRAGYGETAESVPPDIRAAMKLMVGDMFVNRSAGITGTIHTDNPTVARLLDPHRYLVAA